MQVALVRTSSTESHRTPGSSPLGQWRRKGKSRKHTHFTTTSVGEGSHITSAHILFARTQAKKQPTERNAGTCQLALCPGGKENRFWWTQYILLQFPKPYPLVFLCGDVSSFISDLTGKTKMRNSRRLYLIKHRERVRSILVPKSEIKKHSSCF